MAKLGLYASIVYAIASVLIYSIRRFSTCDLRGLWAPTLILYSQAYEQANK